MAKSQLFGLPIRLHPLPRRHVPGPPGQARRGGVHHRAHDPRPGRHRADVRGGRPLAQQAARQAQAGPRPAGARVRACRSCRWRSTAPSTCATMRGCSRRSRSSTASRFSSRRSDHPTREQVEEARRAVFERIRDDARRARAAGQARRARALRTSASDGAPVTGWLSCGLVQFRRTCQLTVISATFSPSPSVSSTSTGNSTFPSASSRSSSASFALGEGGRRRDLPSRASGS